MITAVGIKRLLYVDISEIKVHLTGTALKAIIAKAKPIKNVHQDTWSVEESEASTTPYKNQLSGGTYRMEKDMGDVSMAFTIGQYDYPTKAELLGGTATATSWSRPRGVVDIYKCLIAQTKDDQWVVFPKAQVMARESNTDKAIGLAVKGIALEPDNVEVMPEYWFDDSEVKAE